MPVPQDLLDGANQQPGDTQPVYPARPEKAPAPDYGALRTAIMTKFRKTLAYLAK